METNELKPMPKNSEVIKGDNHNVCKRAKKPTAPSAAARAAACIEDVCEHRLNMKYMEEEHKLQMELLRTKIEQAKVKMEVQKSSLATLKDSPKIFL
ncbi:hypothetical protein TNCT_505271 [Trichonephila clavata]|uniref:Uncharacterized protein n=1 Tax=Trichonephila clavata TaxID=2740835 RepID=A0A8X6LB67_TRICU|nr:hypothetical protein TNCT_505271 [Trichonephila clavata]